MNSILKQYLWAIILVASILLAFWIIGASGATVEVYNDRGKRDDGDWKQSAQQIFVSGGKEGRWLSIVRDPDSPEWGFTPGSTYAYSRFKPVIRELPKGYWGISFTP